MYKIETILPLLRIVSLNFRQRSKFVQLPPPPTRFVFTSITDYPKTSPLLKRCMCRQNHLCHFFEHLSFHSNLHFIKERPLFSPNNHNFCFFYLYLKCVHHWFIFHWMSQAIEYLGCSLPLIIVPRNFDSHKSDWPALGWNEYRV